MNEYDKRNGLEVYERKKPLSRLGWLLGGSLVLALVALGITQVGPSAAVVGIGILIYLAAFGGGGGLGFLFAVPRVLAKKDSEGKDMAPSLTATSKRLLDSNTSLERISDWLSTMLVGVGLSQINNLGSFLKKFSVFLAGIVGPGLIATQAGGGILPLLGPILLVSGSVSGFLFMYLVTRLELAHLFLQTEQILEGKLDPQTQHSVQSFAKQAALDPGTGNFALKQIAQSDDVSVNDAIDLMNSMLYRPGGYSKVIDLAAKLSATRATRDPDYWFYLAAAFGQKYSALRAESDENSDKRIEMESARENALDAARRAVRLDQDYREELWRISDPEGPDSDLSDFRNDKEFRRITGK